MEDRDQRENQGQLGENIGHEGEEKNQQMLNLWWNQTRHSNHETRAGNYKIRNIQRIKKYLGNKNFDNRNKKLNRSVGREIEKNLPEYEART